ncbi:type II secretion system protein GspM [Patulibacter brassicae]|uniref:Type II secretion system protein GspM n=1 Tax=Patulibacter brassicae TaxID=1705717 RepID=A0ABU4VNR8_9ACTN|nr:type II secretion system protein GspM [Patulibacter brassicae]MDX8153501.1 type II secretion system protein GspM [Patulibacter brassicae]
MTDSMRNLLAGVAVLAVAALLWLLLVSPARNDAAAAEESQQQAEAQAAQVQTQLAQAREAGTRADANVRALKRLAVAVPEKVEAAQLIDQLESTADRFDVSFDVLKVTDAAASAAAPAAAPTAGGVNADGTASGTTTTGAATATAAPAADGTDAAAAGAPAGVPVGMSVQVSGSYTAVTRFVRAIQGLVRTPDGKLRASGRLLRVDSVNLAVGQAEGARSLAGSLELKAYLLPREAATAAAPAPGTGTTTTTGGTP